MPTTTVVRLASSAPPLNADYEFDIGDRRFVGRVVEVRALNATRVS